VPGGALSRNDAVAERGRDALGARKHWRTVWFASRRWRRGVAFTLCDEGVAATSTTASVSWCGTPVLTRHAATPVGKASRNEARNRTERKNAFEMK